MNFASKIQAILEAIDTIEQCNDVLPALLAEFPKLSEYLGRFDIDINKLYPLGAGCQGTAYSDGKIVVKFTEDTQEVKASARLMEKPVAGVNPIIHVGRFDRPIMWHKGVFSVEGSKSYFYLIIQDLQDTNLTPDEQIIAGAVGDFLVEFFHREDSTAHQRGEGLIALLDKLSSKASISAIAKHLAEAALKGHSGKTTVANLMIARKLMEAVINLYLEAGVRFFDVQPGNVAKDRDGNYILIDIGVSQTRGRIPPYGVIESKLQQFSAELVNYGLEVIH